MTDWRGFARRGRTHHRDADEAPTLDATTTRVSRAAAWLLAAVACLAAPDVRAEPSHFRHFDTGDGLPQAQVMALHQDPSGFLWVGTFGGLGRFDGRTFVQYSTSEGLRSNTVRAIASEADGSVWAGLSRGLCVLRPRQVQFECPQLAGISGRNVQSLLSTPDGLWVGTGEALHLVRRGGTGLVPSRMADGGVLALAAEASGAVWAGGAGGLARVSATGEASTVAMPSQAEVRALHVDGARLWIGTNEGLLLRQDGVVGPAPGLGADVAAVEVRGLAPGAGDELWVATRLGLLRRQAGVFSRLGARDGLADENVHTVLHDREGVVWIASDAGLSSQVGASFAGYGEAQGLAQTFVRALAEDHRGRLWLGTRRGVQVVSVDRSGHLHDAFRIDTGDGLVDDRIYDIVFPRPGEALLATGHGLAYWREAGGLVRLYTEADGLPANAVRALHARDDGSVLVATMAGVASLDHGTIRPIAQPELARVPVISISRGGDGRIWFGSLQHGLLSLDARGAVTRLDARNGLTDETVWHTAPDADGGLWIGTNGDGLFHLTRSGTLRRYTTRDGLVDNFIWQVLVDRQGQVWAYTNRGLARFDGQDFSGYGVEDGLLDQEGAATAALQTLDGRRWFGSNSGLMRFVGNDQAATAPAPPVVIHQALASGAPMGAGTVLPPGTRGYEFHFSAPLFRRTSDLLYRYRLRGASDEWDELRSYRPIAYANLGPGRYTFEAQARTSGRDWTAPPTTFAFEVAPPVWQAAWFRALVACTIALALWMLVRLRLRQVKAGRAALAQLVRERTRALEHANQQLEQASFTDPLTDLRNRRYLASRVDSDVAQVHRAYAAAEAGARRNTHPNRDMVFAMIDVDHFKQVNDTHGHDAGDRILREFAQVIRSVIRDSDYAVRWGGEEFLLVLRQTEAAECALFAERLAARVRDHAFAIDDEGTTLHTTCSIGMSHVPFVPGMPMALTWSQLIAVCDAAVYLAKATGRDRWVAIHGVPGRLIDDPVEFVQRLKSDPMAMAAEGWVTVSGGVRADLP